MMLRKAEASFLRVSPRKPQVPNKPHYKCNHTMIFAQTESHSLKFHPCCNTVSILLHFSKSV